MRRQLAALMVADVVESSRLMAEDEARAIAAIRELKTETLMPLVTEHGGDVLKHMGDGWIVAFASTSAAVACAMAVQTKLVDRAPLKLRIGAHLVELVHDDTDFHGTGVNIAARLQAEAPPGGLMVSQDVHRQLTGPLASAFVDAGAFELKHISLPVNGFQWRPPAVDGRTAGEVPSIGVDVLDHDPDDRDTRAAARDLRDQLMRRLARRTGVRVVDVAADGAAPPTYRLRGRLRLAAGRGRLHLALSVAEDGRTAWSETYEEDPRDIFAFADALVERADAALRLQINAFDGDRLAHLPVDALSVSELRARAAAGFYKPTLEDWLETRRLLERALALTPDDPMALAMRAEATIMLAAARHEELAGEIADGLEQELDQAIERLPRSDYAFFVRAMFAVFVRGDTTSALRDLERTLALTPNYAPGLELRGLAHLRAGEPAAAAAELERAVAVSEGDPLLPYRLFMLALAHHLADAPARGLAAIERAIQERPSQRNYHLLKAICAEATGNDAARRAAERRAQTLPGTPSILAPRPPLPPEQSALARRFGPA